MAASLSENWIQLAASKVHTLKIAFENHVKKTPPLVLPVFPWLTVKELKEKVNQRAGLPVAMQRLFWRNIELLNHKTLDEYHLTSQKDCKITLKINTTQEGRHAWIDVYGSLHCPSALVGPINEIKNAFNSGIAPQLTIDGTSGTYELKDSAKKKLGIFKPIDQEAFAPNNPRGYPGKFGQESFRAGVLSGEACIREVAAYLIDKTSPMRSVPPTVFIESAHPSYSYSDAQGLFQYGGISESNQEQLEMINPISFQRDKSAQSSTCHTSELDSSEPSKEEEKFEKTGPSSFKYPAKYGSLQLFVRSDDVAENLSPSLFSRDQVHKIAILDFRILNLDRNQANILVRKKKILKNYFYELIPVDHGMSFPDTLEVNCFDLCWADWPQAHEPFSSKFSSFILNLNIVKDLQKLDSTFHFRPICLRNARISATLLQMGTRMEFTLAQMALILCRQDIDDTASELELIVEKARSITDMAQRVRKKSPERPIPSRFKKDKSELTHEIQASHSLPSSPQLLRKRSNSQAQEELSFLAKDLIYKLGESKQEEKTPESFILKSCEKSEKRSRIGSNLEAEITEQEEDESDDQADPEPPQQEKAKKVKRVSSQPFFERVESESKKDLNKISKQSIKKLENERNSAFEEQFFHYFESFLEQLLRSKLKKKNKKQTETLLNGLSPNTLRQRSMSIAAEEDIKI